MVSWLPSVPYQQAEHGFWDPVTATLNWCEEDYYATRYVAEIVNTLTNLLFVYLATRGIRNCLKYGHDTIFLIAFVGYALVGLGSFCFHATLTYPMQLVDELSMIYTTCLMVHATFSYEKSRRFSMFLAFCLVGLAIFITLYYHYLQDPAFHQNAYALLTAAVLLRSMYMMEMYLRPSLRQQSEPSQQKVVTRKADAIQKGHDRRDERILTLMWILVGVGLSVFLGGFAIWSLDTKYCSQLRSWRREIGLPWGVLLEGHGWWHLMTGTGAYFYIVWGIWLRHCLNGRQDEFQLDWPSLFFSFPDIVRADTQGSISQGNGYFGESQKGK